MSDDWKWVLRSSQSTRPVLRYVDIGPSIKVGKKTASVFSETRGIVRVSAGDATSFAGPSAQPDLGTAFAIATSCSDRTSLSLAATSGIAPIPVCQPLGSARRYIRNARRDPNAGTHGIDASDVPAGSRGFRAAVGQDAPSLRTMVDQHLTMNSG